MGDSALSSRLSPSAMPFTVNRSNSSLTCGISRDTVFSATGYDDCGYFDDRIDAEASYFATNAHLSDDNFTLLPSFPIDSKSLTFSASDDLRPSATLKAHKSLPTGLATKVTPSNGDSAVPSYGKCNFQHNYRADKLKDSSSSTSSMSNDSYSSSLGRLSSIRITCPPPGCTSAALSKKVRMDCHGGVSKNENSLDNKPSIVEEPYVVLNVKDSKVCEAEVAVDKCEGTNGRTGKVSMIADQDDSDVDSPCWKGMAATNYRFEDPAQGISKLKNEDPGQWISQLKNEDLPGPKISQHKEMLRSLNPWAPHFIPGNAKQSADNSVSDKIAFQEANTFSGEPNLLKGSVVVPSDSEISQISRTQHSNLYQRENQYLNHGYIVSCPDGEGSAEAVGDFLRDNNHTLSNVLFSTSSSKEIHAACKPSPTHLKADVLSVVCTMHDASERLMKNCSNNIDYFNEHEYDIIRSTIDNLSVIMRSWDLHRGALQSSHPNSQKERTDHLKCQNQDSGIQMTDIHDNLSQNGYNQQISCCPSLINRMADTCERNIVGVGGIIKSKDVAQVMLESMVKTNLSMEEMQHLSLLYRNLWLEASAELRSMKRTNENRRGMQIEIG